MNIVLAPRASRDLRANAAYLRGENPAAAHAVLAAIFNSIDALREHPRLGRKTAKAGVRRLPIPGTKYTAFYRIAREDAIVLHVRDGRRKPYLP
jgi:plasmid stabilization system protein ParE